jgi:hypothetical protein
MSAALRAGFQSPAAELALGSFLGQLSTSAGDA